MNKMKRIILSMGLFASTIFSADWSSNYQSMAAFDPNLAEGNRPGYIKPLATYIGSVLNANWLTSVSIPQNFSFEAGLPFNIVFIDDQDRTYSNSDVSTIFGGQEEYVWDTELQRDVIGGNEDLNGLSIFTLPYLQLGFSYYHAKILLRGMYFPSVSELQGYNLLGFGLQYSFGHFFIDKLPPALRDFDVSLLFGYNSAFIGYTPEDFTGELNLDFTTTHTMFVIGYKPIEAVEIMLSMGYETSEMASSGHLVAPSDAGEVGAGGAINPGLTVNGRSGFRMEIEFAFSIGTSFHPVIGADFGATNAINTNVLYFNQTFGEEEKVEKTATEEPTPKVKKSKKRHQKKKVSDEEITGNSEEETDLETSAEDSTATETPATNENDAGTDEDIAE